MGANVFCVLHNMNCRRYGCRPEDWLQSILVPSGPIVGNLPPSARRTWDKCRRHCDLCRRWCSYVMWAFSIVSVVFLNLATKMSSADWGGWTESTRPAACRGGGGGRERGGDGRRCLDSKQTPPCPARSLLSPGQQRQDLPTIFSLLSLGLFKLSTV